MSEAVEAIASWQFSVGTKQARQRGGKWPLFDLSIYPIWSSTEIPSGSIAITAITQGYTTIVADTVQSGLVSNFPNFAIHSNVDNWQLVTGPQPANPSFGFVIDKALPEKGPISFVRSNQFAPTFNISSVPNPGGLVEIVGGSSEPDEFDPSIYEKVENVFTVGGEDSFEDGMDSKFSDQLNELIKTHGVRTLGAIEHLITYERVNADVAGEALRVLGRISDGQSRDYRRKILLRSLHCSHPTARHGAVIGLDLLWDKTTISELRKAIDHESIEQLRKSIEKLVSRLEKG